MFYTKNYFESIVRQTPDWIFQKKLKFGSHLNFFGFILKKYFGSNTKNFVWWSALLSFFLTRVYYFHHSHYLRCSNHVLHGNSLYNRLELHLNSNNNHAKFDLQAESISIFQLHVILISEKRGIYKCTWKSHWPICWLIILLIQNA